MAGAAELEQFALRWDLPMIDIARYVVVPGARPLEEGRVTSAPVSR